ncbi:diguanylate cyclase [Halomonas sp. GFAJ-1]|nr:diguanylate cyclase [Halomonas sp. GFAJ-1]
MSNPFYSQNPKAESAARAHAHRRLHHLASPVWLLSMLALLLLIIIWSGTYYLVKKEQSAVERQAALSVGEILDTYEARVVRALREIDTTLKLVRFTANSVDSEAALDVLQAQELLPPALLFTVGVVNKQGVVVGSTNSLLIEQHYMLPMQSGRVDDTLAVDRVITDDVVQLMFTRPLISDHETVLGWIFVSVEADFFVSSYATRSMGHQGMLAVVGEDGLAHVARAGSEIYSDDVLELTPWVKGEGDTGQPLFLTTWRDEERYTMVRELYSFPLSVVVGLSKNEQLASAQAIAKKYWQRASWASGLLLAVFTSLGLFSWKLQRERQRVIEERILHAEQVEHLAFHDALTELPNRAFFSYLVTQAVRLGERHGEPFALLFLDLDRFKLINDSLGHEAGDHLLQETAKRLTSAVRASDVVARLGGDEFVIIMHKVDSQACVKPVAEKILDSIREPFSLAGHEYHVSVSIGVSLFPVDGLDEQTLIKNADVAMYKAKQAGKNTACFYTEELGLETDVRLMLESGLQRALDQKELKLIYKTKHNSSDGEVIGIEALLRWQHPTLGLLEPSQFISMAEESGLIVSIGSWAIEQACKQSMLWQEQGAPALTIAVDVYERQFYDEAFVKSVNDIVTTTQMIPELLELQVAESTILKDVEYTAKVFEEIKKIDVKIIVDDFGVKYSKLSNLKVLPLDVLNVDTALVDGLSGTDNDQQLSFAVIKLGQCLSPKIFAKEVGFQRQSVLMHDLTALQLNGFYSSEAFENRKF